MTMISASQELCAVLSWPIERQAIGPQQGHMTNPERDRNLKSSRGTPSATVFPNWLPQHAPLNVVRV